MAMARANELANFNIVVEKWDSSKIGGKRGGSKGKPGGAKVYTTARAGTSNTRAAAQDATSSSRIRSRACRLLLRRLFFRH
jgi:hypothetical protein